MVPGHPCYSALGAFHPTPIASNRTSAQPTDRLPPARKTEHGVKERNVETDDDEAAHEHSPPPPALGAITSTRTPAATSRVRGTPTPPPAPPPHPPRRAPPPLRRRRAAREAGRPVGGKRPLHRRAVAKMSPRIRTGPEPVLAAHAPLPPAAAATAQAKPDQVPITEQNFGRSGADLRGIRPDLAFEMYRCLRST